MAADKQVFRVIADKPDALKLVATWPRAGAKVNEAGMAKPLTKAVLEQWAKLSKVMPEDIEDWWPTLAGNEIIGPEGHVDDTVEGLMNVQLAEKLSK